MDQCKWPEAFGISTVAVAATCILTPWDKVGSLDWQAASAVATFLAVIAAVVIPILQRHWAQVARRREPLYALRALIARGEHLVVMIPSDGSTTVYVEHYFKNVASLNALDTVQKALHSFPIEKLMDFAAVASIFEMQDALQQAHAAVKDVLPVDGDWGNRWEKRQSSLAAAKDQVHLAVASLETALHGAGVRR
jgi:hypothetical protein